MEMDTTAMSAPERVGKPFPVPFSQ